MVTDLLFIALLAAWGVRMLATRPEVRAARDMAGKLRVLAPGVSTEVDTLYNHSKSNRVALHAFFYDAPLIRFTFWGVIACALVALLAVWLTTASVLANAQLYYAPTFLGIILFVMCTVFSSSLRQAPTMSVELASLVAGSVSAATGIIQSWAAIRNLRRPMRQDEIQVAQSSPSTERIADAALQASQIVPNDILEAILDTVEQAKARLVGALTDPANSAQARDHEERIAVSVVCRELKRLQGFNGGRLPTELSSIWLSFGCDGHT